MPASHVRRRRLALVGAAALLLTTAGCGGGGDGAAAPPTPTPSIAPVNPEQVFADLRAAAGTGPSTAGALAGGLASAGSLEGEAGSPGADLRAALAAGLVEHVHLTGLAALTEYRYGAASGPAGAAVGALQANAAALADTVGRAAAAERDEFAAAWAERNTATLAYAAAADDGDSGASARQQASADLAANARELGRILADATDDVLSVSAVQRQFVTAASRITAVLDSLGTGTTDAAKLLRSAGDHARDLAASLAGGLDRAAGLDGDPAQAAPALRADMAALLTEGTYLTGFATLLTFTAAEGANASVAIAARDAVDTNAQSLATLIGGAIGRDRQADFISRWRQYVDDLHGYATVDERERGAVGARLAGFPGSAGAFLAEASEGNLAAPSVTNALTAGVQALIAAIDGLRSLKDVPLAAPPTPPASEPVAEPSATPSS